MIYFIGNCSYRVRQLFYPFIFTVNTYILHPCYQIHKTVRHLFTVSEMYKKISFPPNVIYTISHSYYYHCATNVNVNFSNNCSIILHCVDVWTNGWAHNFQISHIIYCNIVGRRFNETTRYNILIILQK